MPHYNYIFQYQRCKSILETSGSKQHAVRLAGQAAAGKRCPAPSRQAQAAPSAGAPLPINSLAAAQPFLPAQQCCRAQLLPCRLGLDGGAGPGHNGGCIANEVELLLHPVLGDSAQLHRPGVFRQGGEGRAGAVAALSSLWHHPRRKRGPVSMHSGIAAAPAGAAAGGGAHAPALQLLPHLVWVAGGVEGGGCVCLDRRQTIQGCIHVVASHIDGRTRAGRGGRRAGRGRGRRRRGLGARGIGGRILEHGAARGKVGCKIGSRKGTAQGGQVPRMQPPTISCSQRRARRRSHLRSGRSACRSAAAGRRSRRSGRWRPPCAHSTGHSRRCSRTVRRAVAGTVAGAAAARRSGSQAGRRRGRRCRCPPAACARSSPGCCWGRLRSTACQPAVECRRRRLQGLSLRRGRGGGRVRASAGAQRGQARGRFSRAQRCSNWTHHPGPAAVHCTWEASNWVSGGRRRAAAAAATQPGATKPKASCLHWHPSTLL